jgi:hypothetical protein
VGERVPTPRAQRPYCHTLGRSALYYTDFVLVRRSAVRDLLSFQHCGTISANSEWHDQVCFEASAHGEFLPSNVALEFTVQYQSVVLSNLDRQRLWLSLFSIKQMREDQQSVVPHHKWQIHPVRLSQDTEEREVIYLGSDHIAGDVHRAANPLLRPGAPVPPIQP